MLTIHRVWQNQRGIALLASLAMAIVVAVVGFLAYTQVNAQPTKQRPLDNLVRGFIAATPSSAPGQDQPGVAVVKRKAPPSVYLPAVTVYLQNMLTNQKSDSVRTDLSGRFTLLAKDPARYRLCWESKVYGDGCFGNVFSAGSSPLFLSTQTIALPAKAGFAASFGKVRFADDSIARTLEPFSDVNAFAVVRAQDSANNVLAEVPVNNFGEYLLPYLPKGDKVSLTTKIEGLQSSVTLDPQIYRPASAFIQYHLTLPNTPPHIDAVLATDSAGKRIQNAKVGDTVVLTAQARDADNDALKTTWQIVPKDGVLSATTGPQIKWTLPSVAGLYSVQAMVADGKGGYHRMVKHISVGAPGVLFAGEVKGTDGALLNAAEVEINGDIYKTNAQGRLHTYVKEAERYVINIRKAGYGFYSRVYDRSVAGGHWMLTKAMVAEFNPTQDIKFQHRRSARDCPGPAIARINWKDNARSQQVWWQDGKGNNVPAPVAKGKPGYTEDKRGYSDNKQATSAILPWQLRAKQEGCGPAIAIQIPANGLQTAAGNAPQGKVRVSLTGVDLNTPEQMPGDDSVRYPSGEIGWMQSYGAGSVELRDTATGERLNLKPGVTARLVLPVDRSQLAANAPLPAKVPLLYYDEVRGVWYQEGELKLDAAKKNYVADVKHFSSLNTDVTYTNPSCVVVNSSITTPFDIEVIIPMAGGAAPKIKHTTVTTSDPTVIYHLPNFTNITITAIAPAVGSAPPRSLGVFVVNTGPAQATGYGAPPPAIACVNSVTLSTQTFPDPHDVFLKGLYSFQATNINESDVATVGSIAQQLDAASAQYYSTIDPSNDRDTFDKFRTFNGFTRPPGFAKCGAAPCEDPDVEINTVYGNSGDLGFGRDMHCRRKSTSSGFDYACYVTNYGNYDTDDHVDADKAATNVDVVATVAMEYSKVLAADADTDRHVKFYVYKADGTRVNRANLDDPSNLNLARPVPQLCMICHGGAYPGGGTTGVPNFSTPASVKFGSRFLPFDVRFFTFPTAVAGLTKADQQSAFKHLNQDIVAQIPPLSGPDAIGEVITEMYNGSATQKEEFVVNGWKQTAVPNTVAQEKFYSRVVGNTCRTCHTAQPFANVTNGIDLQFKTARDFLRTQTGTPSLSPFSAAEQRVCAQHVMPHARRTNAIFWGQFWDNEFGAFIPTIAGQFQVFGDSMKALPRPAGWPAPEAWPPSWNGTLCNIGGYTLGGSSSPPSFYSQMVHPLWSRSYGSNTCSGCHSGLSGTATETHTTLLNGSASDAYINSSEVTANNVGASNLITKLRPGAPAHRMPYNCPAGGLRCLTEAGSYDVGTDVNPADATHEINRILYWINNGALP